MTNWLKGLKDQLKPADYILLPILIIIAVRILVGFYDRINNFLITKGIIKEQTNK